MSDFARLDGAALDAHITGNYGEDQEMRAAFDAVEQFIPSFTDREMELQMDGYEQGVPSPWCWNDASIIDGDTCTTCGEPLEFVPYTRWQDGEHVSWRAFAVCRQCNTAIEW